MPPALLRDVRCPTNGDRPGDAEGARHRGLETITPGLTGQTRWYMKEAAKAKAAAKAGAPPRADQVASFGPVTKNNVKPGSALFFMGWSGSANQWQVAANREGFEPTYSGVNQAQPITSNTNTHSDGSYEYWRIDPMSPGDLPTKFATALQGHDALVKMGCWVRFPKAMVAAANQTSVQTLYIQPEFLKWSHVATVVKVEPGIAMCFETGGGPARLNPRAISRLVGDPAVFVGYKK